MNDLSFVLAWCISGRKEVEGVSDGPDVEEADGAEGGYQDRHGDEGERMLRHVAPVAGEQLRQGRFDAVKCPHTYSLECPLWTWARHPAPSQEEPTIIWRIKLNSGKFKSF